MQNKISSGQTPLRYRKIHNPHGHNLILSIAFSNRYSMYSGLEIQVKLKGIISCLSSKISSKRKIRQAEKAIANCPGLMRN